MFGRGTLPTRRRAIAASLALAAAATLSAMGAPAAFAQEDYPSRPITLVVPFGPGGSTDLLARIVAKAAEKYIGQPFVIVHKPGAGTMLALNELVSAPADGYTISMTNSTLVLQPLYGKARYDYPKELRALAQFAVTAHMLSTHPGTKWKNLTDLVEFAKAHPGEVKYGITGYGNASHLAVEALAMEAGIDIEPVNFDSGAAMAAALLGGHIHLASGSPVDYKEHLKAGTVLALAYFGDKRSGDKLIGQIPTAREQGFDFDLLTWQGAGAPKGVPNDIAAKLEEAFSKALAEPEVQAEITALGLDPSFADGATFQATWNKNSEEWLKLVTDTGILDLVKNQ